MKKLKLLIASLLICSSAAFGHGEDKPGPHGGVIRMPGAFHTEVLIEGAKKFKVYLLDIKFKSPMTKDSSVEATFVGDKTYEAKCKEEKNHFVCEFESEVLKGEGDLLVKATRDKLKGLEAEYSIPLMQHH